MTVLTSENISKKLTALRSGKKGKIYAPLKYFKGLKTLRDVETRYKKMLKKDYTQFKTDKGVTPKRSSYTVSFKKKYPNVSSLNEIARVTGIPLKTIKTIYNRGLAAWRTGHRPGASQHAWGRARVYSFVMKGKTYYTSDKDLRK
jgi:hypothetical protein